MSAEAGTLDGDTLRAAIREACDLTNPRLTEVDWAAVAARLAAARGEPPEPGPAIDVERLARALDASGIVKFVDGKQHATHATVASRIAAEYDRLRP